MHFSPKWRDLLNNACTYSSPSIPISTNFWDSQAAMFVTVCALFEHKCVLWDPFMGGLLPKQCIAWAHLKSGPILSGFFCISTVTVNS